MDAAKTFLAYGGLIRVKHDMSRQCCGYTLGSLKKPPFNRIVDAYRPQFAKHDLCPCLTCLSLAASVGWVARGDNSDGLRTWACSLCIYSIGFTLLGLRGSIAEVYSIIIANFLISLFYSMFLLVIKNFMGYSLNRWIFWLPPLSIIFLYSFMMDSIRKRIFFGNSILSFCGFGEAVIIAERIHQTIEEHCFPDGLRVTVSLGLSMCSPTDTWHSWMSRADQALYRAKHHGRNVVQVE